MTKQTLAEQIREAGNDLAVNDPLTSWREIYLVQRKVSAFFRRWQTAIAHRPAGTMTHAEINAAFTAIYSVTEFVESHIQVAAQNVARETTTLEEMPESELDELVDTAEGMAYHLDRAVNLVDAMRIAIDNDTFLNTGVVTGIMELGSRGLAAIRDKECMVLQGFAVRAAKAAYDRKETSGIAGGNAMTVSNAQLALIHTAKRKLALSDETYRSVLAEIGGVTSSKELDREGFGAVMGFFEYMGFAPAKSKGANYGQRPGMASFAQIELVRTLWLEWTRYEGTEDSLNTWLERYWHVSSLRFLTAETAPKVIGALRTMKSRHAA